MRSATARVGNEVVDHGDQPESQQAAVVRPGRRVRRAVAGGCRRLLELVRARRAGQHRPAREAQLATLRAEIDRGLATAKRLPEFRREVGALEAQLERLRAVLPEEQDVADLLRRVQAMATQSNLTILGFTPQAVAQEADARRVADRAAARRHVSRPGGVPRARQQVPAHHQRGRHQDRGAHQPERRRDGHRRVHGDDVRAAHRAGVDRRAAKAAGTPGAPAAPKTE